MDTREIIQSVIDNNFEKLTDLVPNGIEHRGDLYVVAEDFEVQGDYQTDARYIIPARDKLKNECLKIAIAQIEDDLPEIWKDKRTL